jgi:hypothetical protein
MTIDETTIKFLNMKIERMHQEIEYWMDENSKHKNKIVEANKILIEITKNAEFQCFDENDLIPCKTPCARKYELLCEKIQELRQCLSQEPLACDKSKEPPCHLEPSTELCQKCELNSQEQTGKTKP